jgi:hypothetical protein
MLSNSHHFRKTVAGMCMVAAPLLLLVAAIIHPAVKTDEAAQLAVVADHTNAWYLAHLLAFGAVVLALPAVLGLMHMLREREVAFGHVGGALALIGLIGTAAVVAVEFVVWEMVRGGANRTDMTALLHRITHDAGTLVPIYIVSLGLGIGFLALAMGLYRARAVQSWMAAFIAIGGLVLDLSGIVSSVALFIVGAAFLFVGLGSVGRMVMSETDAEWDHTPEYRGFRPLAGMR